MKKLILLLLTVFIILSACNNDEANEIDFEGKVLGATAGWNLLTVFVEDNYGGYEINIRGNLDDFDRDQYWVEAYRVQLTDETVFINDESGEEYTLSLESMALDDEMFLNNQIIFDMLYSYGRGISVKVNEDFEQKLLDNRNDYILHSQEFLPIYTADEIRFQPLTYEDFLFVTSSDMSEYTTVIIWEQSEEGEFYNEYNEHWEDLDELNLQISYSGPRHTHLTDMEKERFLQYPVPIEVDEYPFYIIIDGDDHLVQLNEWDEVLDFFLDRYDHNQ